MEHEVLNQPWMNSDEMQRGNNGDAEKRTNFHTGSEESATKGRIKQSKAASMTNATEATTSKKRRVKPSIWRRLFAWGPFGLVVLLWFHSLLFSAGFRYSTADALNVWEYRLTSNIGQVLIYYSHFTIDHAAFGETVPESEFDFQHKVAPLRDGLASVFSSYDYRTHNSVGGPGITWTRRGISIPYWWLAALATGWVCLLVWWRKRRGATDCFNCGYDLRGSKGACPECGTLPQSEKEST